MQQVEKMVDRQSNRVIQEIVRICLVLLSVSLYDRISRHQLCFFLQITCSQGVTDTQRQQKTWRTRGKLPIEVCRLGGASLGFLWEKLLQSYGKQQTCKILYLCVENNIYPPITWDHLRTLYHMVISLTAYRLFSNTHHLFLSLSLGGWKLLFDIKNKALEKTKNWVQIMLPIIKDEAFRIFYSNAKHTIVKQDHYSSN